MYSLQNLLSFVVLKYLVIPILGFVIDVMFLWFNLDHCGSFAAGGESAHGVLEKRKGFG